MADKDYSFWEEVVVVVVVVVRGFLIWFCHLLNFLEYLIMLARVSDFFFFFLSSSVCQKGKT
jgi:hypothetical protein